MRTKVKGNAKWKKVLSAILTVVTVFSMAFSSAATYTVRAEGETDTVKVILQYMYVDTNGENVLYEDTQFVTRGTTWGEFFATYGKCYENGTLTDVMDDSEWELYVQNVHHQNPESFANAGIQEFNTYMDHALVTFYGIPSDYKHAFYAFLVVDDNGEYKDSGTGFDILVPKALEYGSKEAIDYVRKNKDIHKELSEYFSKEGTVVSVFAVYDEPQEFMWDAYQVRIEPAGQKSYTYRTTLDWRGEEVTGWVNNQTGENLGDNPGEIIKSGDELTIAINPTQRCAKYLAGLYLPNSRIRVNRGVEATFGSEENPTSIQWLTVDNAKVTVYAEGGEREEDGFLPGSVYGVSPINSDVEFHGNIQYLYLGDEFEYNENDVKQNKGTITVDGNVYTLEWYKTTTVEQDATKCYRGFEGSASVGGTITRGCIREMLYSNALGSLLKAETASILPCLEGKFAITDGVLSEDVELCPLEADVENFIFEYSCFKSDDKVYWMKTARYPSGMETGVSVILTEEEARALLEESPQRISLCNATVPVEVEGEVDSLYVQSGIVTVGGVVKHEGSVYAGGETRITSYGKDVIDVTINGDADDVYIHFTEYNPNMSVKVTGEVKHGVISKFSMQSDRMLNLGEFSVSNMEIIKNGIWNPDLFLMPENSTGSETDITYHPLDEIIVDEALDLQKGYEENGKVLTDCADVLVGQTDTEIMDALDENVAEILDVDSEIIAGLDIAINSYTVDDGGNVISQEQVTELEEGKDLEFTVKVPKELYDAEQVYTVVRSHEENGETVLEELETEMNGEKLTFSTDKFSSFLIVAVDREAAPKENPFADVEESSWKYSFAKYALENNMMNGVGADANGKIQFAPDMKLSRGQLVTILYSMEGKPAIEYAETFTDVAEGQWYAKAVLWANEKGIANGVAEGIFNPDGKITREQVATMLKKYAEYKGYAEGESADLATFTDSDQVSSWAIDKLSWAVAHGVINGKPGANGLMMLDPKGETSRAECAAMLKSFCVKFEQE